MHSRLRPGIAIGSLVRKKQSFSLAIGLSSSITPMICDSSASMVEFVVLPAAFVPRRRRVALGSATGVLFPAINNRESGTPQKKTR